MIQLASSLISHATSRAVSAGVLQRPPGLRAATAALVLRGEGLHQQQRRAGVDRVAEVDLLHGQLLQHLGAASGVVGDDDVQVPEGAAGGVHEPVGVVGVGQVRADVLDPPTTAAKLLDQGLRATGVGTPRLLRVVRGPRVQQHRSAISDEPPGHTGPDGDPTAGTRQQDDAAAQGHGRARRAAAHAGRRRSAAAGPGSWPCPPAGWATNCSVVSPAGCC